MEYPHWLIVVGAVLLVLGFVGIALRQRAIKGDLDEDMASDQGQPSRPNSVRPRVLIARRSLKSRNGTAGLPGNVAPMNRWTIHRKFKTRPRNDGFCLRQHQQAGWRTRARQGSSSPRTPRKPGSRKTIPKALPSSMRSWNKPDRPQDRLRNARDPGAGDHLVGTGITVDRANRCSCWPSRSIAMWPTPHPIHIEARARFPRTVLASSISPLHRRRIRRQCRSLYWETLATTWDTCQHGCPNLSGPPAWTGGPLVPKPIRRLVEIGLKKSK